MAKFKALVNFSNAKFSDEALVAKSSTIIEKMTDNTYFPTPDPPLADVTKAGDTFDQLRAKAVDGSKVDTIAKNRARLVLVGFLQSLAAFVNKTANGDELMLASSGFDLSKAPATRGPLDAPDNFKTFLGAHPGEVIAECDPIPGARLYLVEYAPVSTETETIWMNVSNAKRKFTITGLKSRTEYKFRMVGLGADPTRNYSNELTIFVL